MTHSANRSLIASQSEWVLENNDALQLFLTFLITDFHSRCFVYVLPCSCWEIIIVLFSDILKDMLSSTEDTSTYY